MIKHDGKMMPVPWNTRVRVRFRNGETDEGIANVFNWVVLIDDDLYDIIEYEVIQEAKSEREFLILPFSSDGVMCDEYICKESEFMDSVREYVNVEAFFEYHTVYTIKDGKFVQIDEGDIETKTAISLII